MYFVTHFLNFLFSFECRSNTHSLLKLVFNAKSTESVVFIDDAAGVVVVFVLLLILLRSQKMDFLNQKLWTINFSQHYTVLRVAEQSQCVKNSTKMRGNVNERERKNSLDECQMQFIVSISQICMSHLEFDRNERWCACVCVR